MITKLQAKSLQGRCKTVLCLIGSSSTETLCTKLKKVTQYFLFEYTSEAYGKANQSLYGLTIQIATKRRRFFPILISEGGICWLVLVVGHNTTHVNDEILTNYN